MKHLLLTTALTSATAFGAMAQTGSDDMSEQDGSQSAVPAFFASDLTGKTLYTLDAEDARAIGERGDSEMDANGMTDADRDRMRWTSSDTFRAQRDDWENVGSVDEIVMTMDGEIRGVLLDIGGFLGIGATTVLVDIDDLHFVTQDGDADDIDDFDVVIAMSEEELENLPEWDDDQLRAGFAMRSDQQQDQEQVEVQDQEQAEQQDQEQAEQQDQEQAEQQDQEQVEQQDQEQVEQQDQEQDTASAVFSDDYMMLEGEERTIDRLIGADVYDTNGENIGSVDDVLVDDEDRISDVLVDVGGFLGIGAHTVRMPLEDARIGWSESNDDVRVQVMMTAEELEAMPEYAS